MFAAKVASDRPRFVSGNTPSAHDTANAGRPGNRTAQHRRIIAGSVPAFPTLWLNCRRWPGRSLDRPRELRALGQCLRQDVFFQIEVFFQ
jgi:hypothetical protein